MAYDKVKMLKFLNCLDELQQDYTCQVCSQLCEDPGVLSTCFHMICSSHYDSLTHCPNCKIPLTNCTIYKDDRLQNCVNSTRELGKMFEGFKNDNATQISQVINSIETSKVASSTGTSKRAKPTIDSDIFTNENKLDEPNIIPDTLERVNTKRNKKNELLNISSTSSKLNKDTKKNNKGETSLHVACRMGKVDKVIELLQQGVNTNTKDNAGWTPLHEVVQNGRLDLVKLLLEYNTLVNVPGQSNETPLHEAIRYNRPEIALELIKHGADINARNCKGETPKNVASKEMEKILNEADQNLIQTQRINVSFIAEVQSEMDSKDMKVYCISGRTVFNKLKLFAKHHLNIHIEQKYSKKVTHLIVDTDEDNVCSTSLDVLQAIVDSIWIISSDWIQQSTEDTLQLFSDHEVVGVSTKMYNGPRISRYNKYKMLPGIFNGCHFYLHNFHTKYEIAKTVVLTKSFLTKLISDAGGVVLRRVPNPELIPEEERLMPYHAKEGSKLSKCSHYIIYKDIYEPMYNMSHIKALPIGWLIECIEKYELLEPW